MGWRSAGKDEREERNGPLVAAHGCPTKDGQRDRRNYQPQWRENYATEARSNGGHECREDHDSDAENRSRLERPTPGRHNEIIAAIVARIFRIGNEPDEPDMCVETFFLHRIFCVYFSSAGIVLTGPMP